jgi:hypothetical protein
MSILLHVSLRRNLPSIWRFGLSPAFARCGLPVVWLCAPSRREWALAHVAARHGVPVASLIVLRVSVPRSQLVRRRRFLWTCSRVVRSIVSVSLPAAA